MKQHHRQDQINDALAILLVIQSFLADTRGSDVTLETDGLYALIECVTGKLKAASA